MDINIERLIRERDELNSKIKRVEKFLVIKTCVDAKRTVLMEQQLKSMKDYLFYLEERLHYELTLKKIGRRD